MYCQRDSGRQGVTPRLGSLVMEVSCFLCMLPNPVKTPRVDLGEGSLDLFVSLFSLDQLNESAFSVYSINLFFILIGAKMGCLFRYRL